MTTASGQWTYTTHRVSKFADSVMEKVISVFATAGVPLPDRKFFTVGQPVHDCEELVVVFEGLRKGFPGGEEEAANCDMPTTGSFSVHLVRCFPIGNGTTPPSGPELTFNADEAMVDSWLLMQAIDELNRDPFTGLGGMVYSVSAGEPAGGYNAVVAQLDAMVP